MAILASDIITAARITSDLKTSRFLIDDPDLLGMLNDLLSELYDMFVIEKEGYFQSSAPLTLVNNTANLPSDFYKELGLYSGSAPNQCPIDPLESYSDRYNKKGYWLTGRTIQIFPLTVAPSGAVTIDYVPTCPVLLIGTSIPVDLEKFQEWLKVGLSIKIREARKQSAGTLQSTFLRLTSRITKMATKRKSSPKAPAMPASEQGYRLRNRPWVIT